MSSAMERRVAQLEHQARMDREAVINLHALVIEMLGIVDPATLSEVSDELAIEHGYEPGGEWVIRRHGSETN